jgi:hypothetical protein
MLRKIFLAALLVFAVNSVAFANVNFKIVNETGKTITQIYISPISEKNWKLQSTDFVPNGEYTFIDFDPSPFLPRPMLRYFDIGVNYDDFSQETWFGLDLYNYEEIHLQRGNFTVTYK